MTACDAVVIGAGANGLAAAAYLAMAGKQVLVLDQRDTPGGLAEASAFGNGFRFPKAAHALYALDPQVMRELRLSRHGLRFAVRDMPLVGLRADGKHLVLERDVLSSTRHIAVHSEADAKAWALFRREWFSVARSLRELWWRAGPEKCAALDALSRQLVHKGLGAWLDGWFESDALKATLAFDAHALSPLAAGSALALHWRAAQEMCGLQGATAFPRGGVPALIEALAAAARKAGASMRMNAPVADIALDSSGAATGVVLASGETIAASVVLSSLSRRRTLMLPAVRAALDFGVVAALESETDGVQMAHVALALDAPPMLSGSAVPSDGRFVVTDHLDGLAAAHAAAYAGRLPRDLSMEVILPPDPKLAERPLVSVLVGPVPKTIEGGWKKAKTLLAAKVVAALSRHIAGLSGQIVALDVLSPDDARELYGADDASGGPVDATRLLAGWRARVKTPIPGLLLCGAAADPVGAVSGRGGRMAACYVFEQVKP
jgi:phytoene dehydrogenase-like protein